MRFWCAFRRGNDVVCVAVMSGPTGKLPPQPRRSDAGIARGPGLAVAGVTAMIVFVIGLEIFPTRRPPSAPPPAPPVVQTPPPPVVDTGTVATPPAAEAGAIAAKEPDAGTAEPEKKEETAEKKKPESEKATAEEKAPPSDERKPIDKQRQADRELAREAWRRNRPDISVNGNKTAILVPIRGSIKGADFKIIDKRRKVIVTLPKAVSMVTLHVYNLKHPSFKKVWIDQDEANAQPADGSKLRFILSQAFDPQVEITEDFVRVTIRRPESADSSGEEKHSEKRRDKHVDRAEKPAPEPEETAPAEKD